MQEVVTSSSKKTKLEPEVTEEGVQELHVVFDRYISSHVVMCNVGIVRIMQTRLLKCECHTKKQSVSMDTVIYT